MLECFNLQNIQDSIENVVGMPTCTIFVFHSGEVLNAMVKQATKIIEVVGIKVPKKGQQQILSQYANDIKITIIILFINVLSIRDFLKVFPYGELKNSIK
jgi:hypothetical protein